jgi:ceramide glucosyltransferase
VILLYILSALTILQGIVTLLDGFRAAQYMRRHRFSSDRAISGRRVAVFCPCKGIDSGFELNVRSILAQDFPAFDVYFIVESERDAAFGVLKRLAANVLIAGEAKDCGQKVHNLRFAVERVGPSADIFVFCDSDARFPTGWLRQLTRPLEDDGIAVSTGFRWYLAERFHLPTLLRSAWNATAVGLLGDHTRNFAWGGSMALTRHTFERLMILDVWRGAVSDDYAITRAAQNARAKIYFVPACLIPSYGECSWQELLEFTTRQIIITRVYHPRLWRIGFAAQTIFNATFVGLLVFMWSAPAILPLWLVIYALSSARAAARLSAVRDVLADPSLSRFRWFYILSSPIVALLYQYNMVMSAVTTNIEWRQIHYSLISPNETRVRRSSANAS